MQTQYTFKRGVLSLIWSLFLAVGGGIVLAIIISIFTENYYITYGISGGVTIVLLYVSIFSENIKFEIKGAGFKYYKRKKLIHDLNLKDYSSGYKQKTSDGSTDDISLFLINNKNGENIYISTLRQSELENSPICTSL